MSSRFLVCLIIGLMSACVSEVEDALDPESDDVESAREAAGETEIDAWHLVESLDDGELTVASRELRTPLDGNGDVEVSSTVAFGQPCATYYGSCTGISGCSTAYSPVSMAEYCGSFRYAWIKVCGGVETGRGWGICLW
jgi:hypothetical protein